VNYHAQITYTENHLAHVKVIITKIDPSEHLKFQKTSEVHLTMFSKKELKSVRPKTYEEAVDYLDGKRRVTRISNSLWEKLVSSKFNRFLKITRWKVWSDVLKMCFFLFITKVAKLSITTVS